jgi:hypothetical protein
MCWPTTRPAPRWSRPSSTTASPSISRSWSPIRASGIRAIADLKGRTFAFGDKGSTSGYLIPLHYFMTQGIDPETYFARKVLHTRAPGDRDAGHAGRARRWRRLQPQPQRDDRAGADPGRAVEIFWQSAPLPNDAVAVSKALYADKAFVGRLQAALADVGGRAEDPARPAAAALHRLRQPRQRLLQADPRRRARHRQAAGPMSLVRPARLAPLRRSPRLSRAGPGYALLVGACVASLLAEDELSLGRNPLANLI